LTENILVVSQLKYEAMVTSRLRMETTQVVH